VPKKALCQYHTRAEFFSRRAYYLKPMKMETDLFFVLFITENIVSIILQTPISPYFGHSMSYIREVLFGMTI
jgi:hypothetical protein